jgi:hypothetical protein
LSPRLLLLLHQIKAPDRGIPCPPSSRPETTTPARFPTWFHFNRRRARVCLSPRLLLQLQQVALFAHPPQNFPPSTTGESVFVPHHPPCTRHPRGAVTTPLLLPHGRVVPAGLAPDTLHADLFASPAVQGFNCTPLRDSSPPPTGLVSSGLAAEHSGSKFRRFQEMISTLPHGRNFSDIEFLKSRLVTNDIAKKTQ